MPKSEVILWKRLKDRNIFENKFLRQYSVDRYIIDFYCAKLKLGIEVDGDSHFVTEEVLKKDKEREEYIKRFGIEIIRFTNSDVCENINGVLEVIRNKIEELKS